MSTPFPLKLRYGSGPMFPIAVYACGLYANDCNYQGTCSDRRVAGSFMKQAVGKNWHNQAKHHSARISFIRKSHGLVSGPAVGPLAPDPPPRISARRERAGCKETGRAAARTNHHTPLRQFSIVN